jgi:hypothetical protein
MVRCPPGQHRNRATGNCESCPPGTRRQGRKCVPVAPMVAPVAPMVAPVLVGGPVAPLTIHWPPRPTRCPPGYNRSKHAPFNCEKCPVNTRRNNRTRMCDPTVALVAPVAPVAPAIVPAPIPGVPIAPANPNITPLIVIPRAAGLKCPRGTRRNHRTRNCEGCPARTRRVRNECHRIAPGAVHAVPAARAAPVHAANTLRYSGRLSPATNDTETILNTRVEQIIRAMISYSRISVHDPAYQTIPGLLLLLIDETYNLIQDMRFQNVSIHVFMYFMEKTLRLLFSARTTPAIPVFPHQVRSTYALLYKVFLENTLQFSPESVHQVLMSMPRLNETLCAPDMFGNVRLGDEILEVFEDHGAYYRPNGIVYLKPAALMRLQTVVLPQTPMVAPAQMFDLDEFGDVPFNPNVPDKFCIVVEDGTHVSAATFDIDIVRKAINPRTPRWLYMTCVRAITGYYIDDATVHHHLYLGLQKMGFPQQVYVDVNQLHTAISNGHRCVIVKPRVVGGRPYVPPLASASLFKVHGNVMGRSHCEVGHIGGIYDLFLPVAPIVVPPPAVAAPVAAVVPQAPTQLTAPAAAVAEPDFLNRPVHPDIVQLLALSDDFYNDRLDDEDTDTFERLQKSTVDERLRDYDQFYEWFRMWLRARTGKPVPRRESTSLHEIIEHVIDNLAAIDATELALFTVLDNKWYFKDVNEYDMMSMELFSFFGLTDEEIHA